MLKMDIVDGGMLMGEKILLTSNSSKQARPKVSSAERKLSRGRTSTSRRKGQTQLTSKSRETEKEEEFDTISSEISSDSDSDVVPDKNIVNNNESGEVIHRDSERLSRKDSGLPSSRSSLSSIASLQQSDSSPDDVTKVASNSVPPLKLSKNAEQVLTSKCFSKV